MYMRRHCESALDGLPLFADDRLLFEPGTRYRCYSPYGWTLVGAAVEAAAGEPFVEFLHREVLEPLQMRDTVLDDPDRTSFYWPTMARDPSYGVEGAIREDAKNTCIQGAGALLSTPTDVVRFGLAMLEGRLLRAETLAMLRTPLELESGESTGYGLGWFVSEISIRPGSEPTPVYGHEGSSVGGTTSLVILPEHGVVVVATTNVSFATSLATERELGAGVHPFLRASSLPRVLANTFAQASTPTQ